MTIESLGLPAVASATFNRPADTNSYAAGDLIANVTTTNPQVTPLTFQIADVADDVACITRVRLKTNDATFSGKQVTLHLHKSLPVLAVGDNGVFGGGVGATESDKLDAITFTFGAIASSDGWYKTFAAPSVGGAIVTSTDAGLKVIYGVLESVGAVATPGSAKTWTCTLEILGRR